MMYETIEATKLGKCIVCGEEITGHLVKEGARYHVLHWDTYGEHCSNKECIINHGEGKCQKKIIDSEKSNETLRIVRALEPEKKTVRCSCGKVWILEHPSSFEQMCNDHKIKYMEKLGYPK